MTADTIAALDARIADVERAIALQVNGETPAELHALLNRLDRLQTERRAVIAEDGAR